MSPASICKAALTPSPSNVRASLARPWLLAPLLAFAAYCLLAAVVPPSDDELYYWCWARPLQWSYYDHPLMTALMIRTSTSLFGNTLFATRLPAAFASAVTLGVIFSLSKPRKLAWWLLGTPLFTFGAVIVTPDTPLILFWSLYLLWLVRVHLRLTPSDGGDSRIPCFDWLLGGLLLGCGVLGKYTMGLAVPAGLLSFALAGRWRTWLPGYVAHGIVAFVLASPILIFNLQNDFAPLLYQWGHAMGNSEPSLKHFGEFLGIQVLLFGTLPLILLPWCLRNARRLIAEPRLRVCFALYGLPYSFFLYKAAKGPLEGNWALVCYIAVWPLAEVWYESVRSHRFWRWAGPASFALPVVCVAFVAIHLAFPLPLPPLADRVSRQREKHELAGRMAETWRTRTAHQPVYVETYQWVSLLRFRGVDARQLDGVSRRSHFTQSPDRPGDVDDALILWEGLPPAKVREGFGEPVLVGEFPLDVQGATLTTFQLWRVVRVR